MFLNSSIFNNTDAESYIYDHHLYVEMFCYIPHRQSI